MASVLVAVLLTPENSYAVRPFLDWCVTIPGADIRVTVKNRPTTSKDVRDFREAMRQEVVDSQDYDRLLFADPRVVGQEGFLAKMIASGGDIVTAVYFDPADLMCPPIWKGDDQKFLEVEEVSEIDGAGFGCCLISNACLAAIDFCEDQYEYWRTLKELGFRCLSCNALICRTHLPDGKIFYKDPAAAAHDGSLFDYEIICPEGIRINGKLYEGHQRVSFDLWETLVSIDAQYRAGVAQMSRRVHRDAGVPVPTGGFANKMKGAAYSIPPSAYPKGMIITKLPGGN